VPRRWRIGAVEYLNATPLVWGLERLLPGCRLILDVPSALGRGLAAGEFDVALIPVAAYLHGVGSDIVWDVAIASPGAVGTVKLFAKCWLNEIRTLALDRASLTSALLTRAALSALHGVHPLCVEVAADLKRVLSEADAAVVIGQDALLAGAQPPEATVVVDLGELWVSWQGLPLVTAVWVFGAGRSAPHVAKALREARDAGVAAIQEIAEAEWARRGLSREVVAHYLGEMLDFRLGPEHVQSVLRYREVLVKEGLLGKERELTFC